MKDVKTIGVLTSGGDAPGMNAAIRAVVRAGLEKGFKVLGIMRGYNGLINEDMVEMDYRSVSNIINRGGTFLYSARSLEFKEDAGVEKAKETCLRVGLDGIVVIGGDGSFRGAADLSRKGIPCIGIPGTIDNDIACSEYTIGFNTALETAMDNIDKLRDTTQSHDRCSVVEVMGRHAGHIALNVGIACGATYIVVNEIPYDLNDVLAHIQKSRALGKKHFIIVVSEGVTDVYKMAKDIESATGIESRATVLGHIQRGGSPTVKDRVVASQMGWKAVELLAEGKSNRVVAVKDNDIVDYDIAEALSMKKTIDMNLYNMAKSMSL
ncbi:MAG: 6-phosphofructokinase [Oscillospiraceae bacterium]|nr:6-phosphofructokinase [Oscillospiraceae bacterium]